MIIFPAIDIKEGKVVRLLQGKFDEGTEYSHDPLDMAKKWRDDGAEWLHIVDLDGAKTGKIQNMEAILNIVNNIDIPVEMGGGIRTIDDIEQLIDGGVKRVILGTKAINDLVFLKELIDRWKDKIAVSLDCSNGIILQKGWTSSTDIKACEFVKELEAIGLSCLIYTDVARDGMLTGPNIEALKELLAVTSIPIISSGGISSIDDIKALVDLNEEKVIGAITGKAIYEGKLNLREAIDYVNQTNNTVS